MCQENETNGLKNAVWEKLVENLSDVAELKGELKTSIAALNEKIDRLLALEKKVEEHSVAIGRIKTVWTIIVGFGTFLVSILKEYLFRNAK